ncbi:peptidase M22, glycoprotease [Rhodoferax ferrireducens T118]|uniref:Peptidase M22, glycoprotease n=1 Tax=Albidiferax ferrireducens (strain ATCC BAA-621 / DSM 15236 / T118) TaxID=338969 RepID=Q222V6_ALBFT|nr:tRNA (adenosine(37)-N6)-threonylcarbamoyltransferase complex dimerization subunit type 1 TsaB [Rhodoferax ferrireducens]ABD67947.1 peptidase M22, glycoprotease [Rhodoferax ferrireducens T118]
MNLLAFDTSTDIMSVAVQRANAAGAATAQPSVWQHSGPGGAQTSAQLIPTIQRLMAQAGLQFADLDAIVFGRGPGSFTGLRTACSVAQGLAFGANLKVLPIDTLLAVAEEARFQQASALAHWQVLALLDARMDEMYAASYVFNSGKWKQIKDYSLIRPENLTQDDDCPLAGNVFANYGARLPGVAPRIEALPAACALLRLAPALLSAGGAVAAGQALPLYIRDKVAKTTLERATEKAAP